MRYIIVTATIALIAGISLGFVVSRGLVGTASAAPKAQAVEEQNLDANGFIAVHEQGTADVNVVSAPPQAAPAGRTILVAENVSLTPSFPNRTFTSGFIDSSDCGRLTVFTTQSGLVDVQLVISADGSTEHGVFRPIPDENIGSAGISTSYFFNLGQTREGLPIVGPQVAVRLINRSSTASSTVEAALLYCSP